MGSKTPVGTSIAAARSYARVEQQIQLRAQQSPPSQNEASPHFANGTPYLQRVHREEQAREERLRGGDPQLKSRQTHTPGGSVHNTASESDHDTGHTPEKSHQSPEHPENPKSIREKSSYQGGAFDAIDAVAATGHREADEGDVVLVQPLDSGGFGPRVGDVGVLVRGCCLRTRLPVYVRSIYALMFWLCAGVSTSVWRCR